MKFTVRDIIAFASIAGLFGLLFIGYDGWVQASITTILAYYFFSQRKDLNR